jgi:hypothetical protein
MKTSLHAETLLSHKTSSQILTCTLLNFLNFTFLSCSHHLGAQKKKGKKSKQAAMTQMPTGCFPIPPPSPPLHFHYFSSRRPRPCPWLRQRLKTLHSQRQQEGQRLPTGLGNVVKCLQFGRWGWVICNGAITVSSPLSGCPIIPAASGAACSLHGNHIALSQTSLRM